MLPRDPVCGAPVEPRPGAPHTDYFDVRYYFCSERCRAEFESEPERYGPGAPIPPDRRLA